MVQGGEGVRRQAGIGNRNEGNAMARRIHTPLLAAALAAALAGVHQAAAQDFPTRPITLIVPYTPGGGNDAMARVVADKMSIALGQQIVIENRGGAGGSIATRQVARAAPDGYTLGLGGTGTLAIDPTLYPNVGYDPRKDFAPVGLIATSALIVLVNPAVPAKTLAEFIAYAKAEPGKINYASAGSGSGIHLGTELLAYMAGIKMTHIPYKGSAPALTDLIGGHVALYFSSLPPAIGLVREGKVRALAVTGPTRAKVFPDIPTVAEAALPGFEAVLHYGIVAPAGTPRPVIGKLNAAMRTALASPDVQSRIDTDGAEPMASTPEQYAADIDREETKWSEIVRRSGAKAE
jgi:tripartite-type tricarboxylate transporter receptor subunit TctC